MDKWLINGAESTGLPPDDRGLAYGDGLFETIAVRDGKCRFLDAHLLRLADGCERLGINGVPKDELPGWLTHIIADARHATIKIIVTRGAGPRGYRVPEKARPTVLIGIEHTEPKAAIRGVKIRFCATLISRNPVLAGIKTLNRLEQVLARAEWSDADIHEGLMSDDHGAVICGTMTNLFYVQDGMVITPLLDQCGVTGVMRNRVIALLAAQNIPCREQPVTRSHLAAAAEIFLTNSQIGVWPVTELEGREITVGPMTQSIMLQLAAAGVVECHH